MRAAGGAVPGGAVQVEGKMTGSMLGLGFLMLVLVLVLVQYLCLGQPEPKAVAVLAIYE
jgi:hypothetical protein